MPNEIKVLHEAKKCPSCGSPGTVSQLGCAEAKAKGVIKPDDFTFLENTSTPVTLPQLAVVSVNVIIVFYDVCAVCGTRYSTRSQLMSVPVSAQIAGSNRQERRHPGQIVGGQG
jgi:hypothetical protein